MILFHDYTSLESAIAALRLQRLVDEGVPAVFEGFDAVGIELRLPVTLDVLADVERLAPAAARAGLVVRPPRSTPPTAHAHAVGDLAERRGQGAAWRERCYRAYWQDGADLHDHEVLLTLADEAGVDADAARKVLGDRSAVAAVRRRSAQRRSEGVGAVPVLLAQRTLVPGLLDEEDLRTLARLDEPER